MNRNEIENLIKESNNASAFIIKLNLKKVPYKVFNKGLGTYSHQVIIVELEGKFLAIPVLYSSIDLQKLRRLFVGKE